MQKNAKNFHSYLLWSLLQDQSKVVEGQGSQTTLILYLNVVSEQTVPFKDISK